MSRKTKKKIEKETSPKYFASDIEDPAQNDIDEKIQKKTPPYMTGYEYAKILAFRSLQLPFKPPVIDTDIFDHTPSAIEVTQEELKQGKVKLVVKRTLQDGYVEYYSVADLHLPHI
jgi:DNA-directed RNA polymerase subunit K/omega